MKKQHEMRVLVIDGQGGSIGRQLVKMICEDLPQVSLTAVGTNSIATANMLKGGAVSAATGENAVVVGARNADVIIGPIGLVIADALLGEVTPAMAAAVGQSAAVRILLPVNRCDTLIAGVTNPSTGLLLSDAMEKLRALARDAEGESLFSD